MNKYMNQTHFKIIYKEAKSWPYGPQIAISRLVGIRRAPQGIGQQYKARKGKNHVSISQIALDFSYPSYPFMRHHLSSVIAWCPRG